MASLIGKFDPAKERPIVDVTISGTSNGKNGAKRLYWALLDTGASGVFITDAVVKREGLVSIGDARVHGATGEKWSNLYALNFTFVSEHVLPRGVNAEEWDKQMTFEVKAGIFDKGEYFFDVLIGCNIL